MYTSTSIDIYAYTYISLSIYITLDRYKCKHAFGKWILPHCAWIGWNIQFGQLVATNVEKTVLPARNQGRRNGRAIPFHWVVLALTGSVLTKDKIKKGFETEVYSALPPCLLDLGAEGGNHLAAHMAAGLYASVCWHAVLPRTFCWHANTSSIRQALRARRYEQ
jgi:hypothetical protein